MTAGLKEFSEWFAGHTDKFVVIGGCAAEALLHDAGMEGRATKDLDIVLVLEALSPEFGSLFWRYIEAGGYQLRQRAVGEPILYRFQKPAQAGFPAVIELFARAPELLPPIADGTHLTPIPFAEAVSSLSAILLDADYYAFILQFRRELDGMPIIGPECLIALKALAWLELRARRAAGGPVDGKDIAKHLGDVIALAALLPAGVVIPLPGRLHGDMQQFLAEAAEDPLDRVAVALRPRREASLAQIAAVFGLQEVPQFS